MAETIEILCSSPPSPQAEHSLSPQAVASTPSCTNEIQQEKEICRICHCEEGPDLPLISPCYCSGSMKYVHQSCLQRWIKSSCSQCCELCMFDFIMETKIKPFWKWEFVEMSTRERRQLYCSIAFIVLTITGVVNWSRLAWSQYKPSIGLYWWIEVAITLVFFNVMVVLMCIQCRVFNKLFLKWKFFNSITFVQNAPPRKKRLRLPRRSTVFTVTGQSTNSVLINDETKWPLRPLHEDDLLSGQGGSNSNNHTDGSIKSVDIGGEMYTPSKTSTKDGSPKTTLSCKMNKELVPVEDHIHPLSEIVVVYTTHDSVSSTGEESSPESPAKEPTENNLQVDSKII